MVLNVEGAPLVFATGYAHELAIHIPNKSGEEAVLAVTADPKEGGFVLDSKALSDKKIDREATGYIRGMWGFEPFDGPSFHLASAKPEQWRVAPSDESALIVGRMDTLHLHADDSACVSNVTVRNDKGAKVEAAWKMTDPGELEVRPALQDSPPGKVTVDVSQFGLSNPDELHLQAYSEAGHLGGFTLYAGDHQGMLRGTRLDEVATLEINGLRFTPGGLSRDAEQDNLLMSVAPTTAAAVDFHPDQKLIAKVSLKDGRTLPLPVTIATPRPQVTLISKSVQPLQPAVPSTQQTSQPASPGPASGATTAPPPPLQMHLSSPDELPLNARLSFSLKSVVPERFPRTQVIDVATDDESLHTTLSVANGKLVLEDAKTVVATLDPEKELGSSAFGPLKFRPVGANGATGDWQPLVQLVRLPVLSQLKCVRVPERQCTLTGSNLFLIDSVASDPDFNHSISVPEGYADLTLVVPHPDATKTLYVKLRDNPSAVNTAQAPASTDPTQQSSAAAATLPAAVPAPATGDSPHP
jgi:hypothetical protein